VPLLTRYNSHVGRLRAAAGVYRDDTTHVHSAPTRDATCDSTRRPPTSTQHTDSDTRTDRTWLYPGFIVRSRCRQRACGQAAQPAHRGDIDHRPGSAKSDTWARVCSPAPRRVRPLSVLPPSPAIAHVAVVRALHAQSVPTHPAVHRTPPERRPQACLPAVVLSVARYTSAHPACSSARPNEAAPAATSTSPRRARRTSAPATAATVRHGSTATPPLPTRLAPSPPPQARPRPPALSRRRQALRPRPQERHQSRQWAAWRCAPARRSLCPRARALH